MFDLVDTAFRYEIELIFCSFLQDFFIGKENSLQFSHFPIRCATNTRRGQISNFRVDLEFLKMTETCTVYATLCHLWIDLWRFNIWTYGFLYCVSVLTVLV